MKTLRKRAPLYVLVLSVIGAVNVTACAAKNIVPATEAEAASVAASSKAAAKKLNTTCAHSSVVIKAAPEIVWRTVHEERESAPDLAYSRIVQQNENETQIEQKFKFFSGGAKCLMNQKEVVNERIDYKLIKSDKLKELRGSWILTPSESGEETTLELSTVIDYGFFFPKQLATALATHAIERRLSHVKKMAEDHSDDLHVKGRIISATHVSASK